MSNAIKFSQLIGKESTIFEYEIGGRTVVYTEPTLESIPSLNKVLSGDLSFTSIYEAARKTLSTHLFKDGESFSEEWLDSIPLGSFMHFLQFTQNPGSPGDKPKNAEPLPIEDFRGFDIVLPPVNLGNIRFFAEYLEVNADRPLVDYMLEQLDTVFSKATLADGSPVPENLLHSLTFAEAKALIDVWMNGQAEPEVKKVKKPSGTGRKRKTSAGRKRSPSSSTPSTSQSSQTTPTTSES